MATKLTLTLDKKTIEQTKEYAKKSNLSLSKLVENYFKTLSAAPKMKDENIPPITRALSGIAGPAPAKSDKALLKEALNRRFL